jgi:hypothetical protein
MTVLLVPRPTLFGTRKLAPPKGGAGHPYKGYYGEAPVPGICRIHTASFTRLQLRIAQQP